MKTLKNLCVFAAILLFNCTTSEDLVLHLYEKTNHEETYNNPYDELGDFYQKLSATSKGEDIKMSEIQKQLHHILAVNNIQILKSNSRAPLAIPPNALSVADPTLSDLIDNSSLSKSARTILHEFTADLMEYNGKNIDFISQWINSYELEILTANLTGYDQQAILTFTALVKSTVKPQNSTLLIMHKKEKEKEKEEDEMEDEDWNISILSMHSFLQVALSQTPKEMASQLLKSLKGL